MDIEVKDKANRRHVGHNLQKIRVYFGMKQEALAADLGVNQQVISKIEKQEEIEEGLLNQIASVLGISALKTLMWRRLSIILIISETTPLNKVLHQSHNNSIQWIK